MVSQDIKPCSSCGTILGPPSAGSGGRPVPIAQGDLAFELATTLARAELAETILFSELGHEIPSKSEILSILHLVETRFRATQDKTEARDNMDHEIMCRLRDLGRKLKVA